MSRRSHYSHRFWCPLWTVIPDMLPNKMQVQGAQRPCRGQAIVPFPQSKYMTLYQMKARKFQDKAPAPQWTVSSESFPWSEPGIHSLWCTEQTAHTALSGELSQLHISLRQMSQGAICFSNESAAATIQNNDTWVKQACGSSSSVLNENS